jgi:hypothetical protein
MKRLLLLLAASSMFLAGCGDDEERLTSAEFEKQANAICSTAGKKLDTAAEKTFGSGQKQPSDAQLEAFLKDDFRPNITQQIDDLRDLNPPKAVDDDLTAILDDADKILDKLTLDDLKSDTNPFKSVNTRLDKLNLQECGSGGDSSE